MALQLNKQLKIEQNNLIWRYDMFITLEGPDGSGKSTIILGLIERLLSKKNNLKYVITREPGGRDIKEAEAIRKIILDGESNLSSKAEAMLYSASRRIHIDRVISPALKENKLVLCDRYIDSFYAYQGYARDLGIEWVKNITEMVIDDFVPNITIYLDINYEQSAHRRFVTRVITDRLDAESEEFHKKVIDGYKSIIKSDPNRFIVIDAWRSISEILDDIIKALFERKDFKEWWEQV
ncbi:dTMP kinase [Mycoplasma tauri]|uniref:dTMP kinase n=1 Tax=Mycoplasma tauri TaxID=547987 RepID=UPI00358F607E